MPQQYMVLLVVGGSETKVVPLGPLPAPEQAANQVVENACAPSPASPEPPSAAAIGDGLLLKLITEYGPKLLALLIQLGIIKLPAGLTFDPNARA